MAPSDRKAGSDKVKEEYYRNRSYVESKLNITEKRFNVLSVLVCYHRRTFCMSPTVNGGSGFQGEDAFVLLYYTSRGKQPEKLCFAPFKVF